MDSIRELNFGDVSSDTEFVSKVTHLNDALAQIEDHVARGRIHFEDPDSIALEDKIDNDLFVLYALNSMYWINLKLQGIDPNSHPVKQHLQKVRELMQAKKDIIDKRTRPSLDKNVAARFIRNGLWQPKQSPSTNPPNKKIKFSD